MAGVSVAGVHAKEVPIAGLSAAAYSGMFGFGIVMALLGAMLPLLTERLHFDLSEAGGLFLEMNAAMLVTTLLLGPALDRYGIRSTMIASPMAVAAAVVLIANAQTSGSLRVALVMLGTGGGALNQATNTLIADLHTDARKKNAALNLLGVFFGFGALFVPFAMGSLLASLGMRNILYGAAALILIPVALSLLWRFPPPRQAGAFRFGEVLPFLRQPLLLAFGLLLFFESGNEFTLGGYISSYLSKEVGFSLSQASYALAGYWAAIMLARLVLGRVLLHVAGGALIRWSALGAAVCLLALSFTHSPLAGVVLVILIGVAIAAIFPTTLGLAGAQYPQRSGTVFGALIGIALAGGMTMPWITGQVAAANNLRTSLWVPAAGAFAIVGLQLVISNLLRREQHE